ncbi:major strawberry allergen Fra a 1-2-like [Aristolochia californica]|uniref:major strawberry allergen Fra a 1-2-like n=1 Tax=Aristolochia californica TaxID=171875 RepID=UPI0035D96FFE
MVAGEYSRDAFSSVPPTRFWKAFADSGNLIPKLLPEVVASIELVEGNGGAGSVQKFNFKNGPSLVSNVLVMDHEKYLYRYAILEGGPIGTLLKTCIFETKLGTSSEGGTKNSLKIEYETLGDNPLTEEELARVVGGVPGLSKAMEGYLVANPDAYA